ncbi:prepilin peptidase [Patescibacteria group bacterium]|nr:prepilin peptidase [Patescibacteria group bacterium]
MILFFLFIFGLIIGSFLNAVIYRLKSGENIVSERSKCPHCRHLLAVKDLVPVLSFIFLRAKCRYCHKKISWQYPLVELATALIFILGYLKYQNEFPVLNFQFLVFLVFSCFLIIIFVYDLKHYLIVDKVSLPAFFIALLINLLLGHPLFNLLLASILVAGFFFFQLVLSKGKWIGGGDVRLGLVMGAMLGWPQALIALFLAYISGSIIGLVLIMAKKKEWHSQIPFGTFLSAATLITLLFGQQILEWYSRSFLYG